MRRMLSTREAQIQLKFMGYAVGTIDGINGAKTRAAVVAFQRGHKLYADGVVGKNTSASILANYNWHWKHDSRNLLIQRVLKYFGYYGGRLDGIIGNQSKSAIKSFQSQHKLTADGIVGNLTWNSLVYTFKVHYKTDGVRRTASVSTSSSGGGVTINGYKITVGSSQLSSHFSRKEFICKHCGHLSHAIDPYLIADLEKMRAHFGRPITITCGLRCVAYNNSLVKKGWAIRNSKHVYGKAADIYMPGVSKQSIINYWYTLPHAHYAYTNNSNMGNAVHVDVA